jgi:dTDP-4-amino-4,6-dideoxygalactose transaminase
MPFVDLRAQRERLGGRIDSAVMRVISHGQYIMGPEVVELESELAQRAGVRAVVTCGSGTEALLLPLMAWQVGPGDAVFVPSFTFPATAEVAVLLGATPVFVDVRADTFNMDHESLRAAVKRAVAMGHRPRAVIAVDLFGQPADYGMIVEAVREESLLLLADAAQSFGAAYHSNPVGSLGDATATSFFPAKPLGCYGDGGAVFTDDESLADVMRSIRSHGEGASRYDIVRTGINGRLDTIQAAVLLQKLRIFDEELATRDLVAKRYSQSLTDLVVTPVLAAGTTSAWAQYTLQLVERDRLREDLDRAGIPTAIYYPRPLHRQPAYTDGLLPDEGAPVAESLSQRVVSLPIHPYLRPETQDRIIAEVLASLRTMGGANR